MTKGNGPLIIGVVLVAFILAAATYIFFVSPRETDRADAYDQVVAQQDINEQLRARIADLKAKQELLPEWRESIYEVRREFPNTEDIPAVREVINEIFESHDLVVFNESFGVPTAVAPTTSLAQAAEAAGVTSQVDGRAFDGLQSVAVTLSTAASYDDMMALLDDLQYGDHIFFLVGGVDATPFGDAGDAAAGVRVRAGDLQTNITLYYFVLDYGKPAISLPPVEPELDEDGNPIVIVVPEPELDEDGNPIEPDPRDRRNPFVPVGASGGA